MIPAEVPNLVAGRDLPATDGRWLEKTRPADGARHGHEIEARVGERVEDRLRQLPGRVGLLGVLPNQRGETASGFERG